MTCKATETDRLGDDGDKAGGNCGVLHINTSVEVHIAGTVYSSLPKRQWISPKLLSDEAFGAKLSPKIVTTVPPSAVPEIGEERTASDWAT